MGWFSRIEWQTLSGMLFGRDKRMVYVRPETAVRHIHEDELIETAEVESVATDPYGILHVKFKLIFSRTNRFSYEEGTRMLALRTFADRYREKVPAVPI